jgi:hypothetical protein
MIINKNGEMEKVDERVIDAYLNSQQSWQNYKNGQMLAVIDLLIKQVNDNTQEIARLKAKLIQQEEK